MPSRKKEVRNPRVRNKNKFVKAQKKRKGQVREMRTEADKRSVACPGPWCDEHSAARGCVALHLPSRACGPTDIHVLVDAVDDFVATPTQPWHDRASHWQYLYPHPISMHGCCTPSKFVVGCLFDPGIAGKNLASSRPSSEVSSSNEEGEFDSRRYVFAVLLGVLGILFTIAMSQPVQYPSIGGACADCREHVCARVEGRGEATRTDE